jgi:hypothetical protein
MRAAPIVLHCICMHLYSLLYSLQTADTALLVILFQFLCAAAYSGTDRNIPIHAVTTVCILHSEGLRRRQICWEHISSTTNSASVSRLHHKTT